MPLTKYDNVAPQVVQPVLAESLESLVPLLVGRDGKPLRMDSPCQPLSDETLLDEEDEADMSILPQDGEVQIHSIHVFHHNPYRP